MGKSIVLLSLIALVVCNLAFGQAQRDFCVTDPTSADGQECKDPKSVQANDFSFSGFNIPGNTSNPFGAKVTLIGSAQIPGLNTLGVALARVDYLPGGLNTPHVHPRATELYTVIEGTIRVGFVTSSPENRLITKVLKAGDIFVFPKGLVHFQHNIGHKNARAMSGLSSENPGIVRMADTIFGSNPLILDDVLTKSFKVDKDIVDKLVANFKVV